jgi:menaquinone-dependent protoporphyrinogen oxidase
MKPIAVFYATREGHSRLIAKQISRSLLSYGFDVDMHNVGDASPTFEAGGHSAAILTASVHAGKHEREMVRFVKSHLAELETLPTVFLSVTLSQAGAEMLDAAPQSRARCSCDAQTMIDKFTADTGWRPKWVKPIAGAIVYSKYNPLVKFIMKRIARMAGGGTDTSHDYVYTDWKGLDRFLGEFAQHLSASSVSQTAAPEAQGLTAEQRLQQ